MKIVIIIIVALIMNLAVSIYMKLILIAEFKLRTNLNGLKIFQ
jgi:hypothetical protein